MAPTIWGYCGNNWGNKPVRLLARVLAYSTCSKGEHSFKHMFVEQMNEHMNMELASCLWHLEYFNLSFNSISNMKI